MTRRIDKPDTEADISLRAQLDKSTSFVMVAGAGSGKTTSLVKALDHIGKIHGKTLRQNGQRIACITYTDVATNEIFGDVGHDPLFHVATIHSFLWELIRPFQRDIRTWVRARIEEKLVELEEERAGFGKRVHQKTKDKNQRSTERYQKLRETIESVPSFRYENGSEYSKGILGHEDIIRMVPALIKERPLLRKLLAQKYPYFFVDESQDTVPEFVAALKAVDAELGAKFCLGFFGDPMQKIYTTGIGAIGLEPGWQQVAKPENFRCPKNVLSVINRIRSQGDDLQQTLATRESGSENGNGSARLFILPADNNRSSNIGLVRAFLGRENRDELWLNDEKEGDVKVLVVVHRMAAKHLGFGNLYSALNDGAPDSFKIGFAEGSLWVLRPFLDVLLPLAEAYTRGNHSEAMALLRAYSPRLSKEAFEKESDPAALLAALKTDVIKLAELLQKNSKASVKEVLHFARRAKLVQPNERWLEYWTWVESETITETETKTNADEESDELKAEKAMNAYLDCAVVELWGYRTYIEDKSPFSTQQGIKGTEFKRVLVVLDDEEGTHMNFSYDKLLGLKPLSDRDQQNQSEGKDSVLERTRRLFYVCCSRAVKDLAVVLFTTDVSRAVQVIREQGIFDSSEIKTIEDLPNA